MVAAGPLLGFCSALPRPRSGVLEFPLDNIVIVNGTEFLLLGNTTPLVSLIFSVLRVNPRNVESSAPL